MSEAILRIFKYKLEVGWRQVIDMPVGAHILSCAMQYESICLWALVNPTVATEERAFHIYGTGNLVHDVERLVYIGTVLLDEGRLVLHVFEEKGSNG